MAVPSSTTGEPLCLQLPPQAWDSPRLPPAPRELPHQEQEATESPSKVRDDSKGGVAYCTYHRVGHFFVVVLVISISIALSTLCSFTVFDM